ncbi:MAG TPA: MBL fold metallo-hydrolase [Polyangiaceae bacterium]|jgi:phosphoribosyl 1,2-cyclic phosphodiesterase|nr:MBL fold metallo-hydrolase [Polyangiaceae bacterium]
MRVFILASGSSGNATLFESKGTRVLVDAGIGPRTLERKLGEAGASGLPHAIVVTHGHGDHLGSYSKIGAKLGIPVFMTESTARFASPGGEIDLRYYSPRQPFSIGALTLSPLPLPHDAAQVALVIGDGERSAAIATDLGEVPPALPDHLAGCEVVLIESNHDVEMLQRGPYPSFLKRRVLSARGHLSNAQTHTLLRALGPRAHTVVLMHLSKTNNRPDIALDSAHDALAGRRVRVQVAPAIGPLALDAAMPPPDRPLPGPAVPAGAPRGRSAPLPGQLPLF